MPDWPSTGQLHPETLQRRHGLRPMQQQHWMTAARVQEYRSSANRARGSSQIVDTSRRRRLSSHDDGQPESASGAAEESDSGEQFRTHAPGGLEHGHSKVPVGLNLEGDGAADRPRHVHSIPRTSDVPFRLLSWPLHQTAATDTPNVAICALCSPKAETWRPRWQVQPLSR